MAEKVSDAVWRMVNKNRGMRDRLRKVGERVAANATRISRANGGTANYRVVEGTRPGGRAYMDVVSDNPAEEYGTEDTPRINALRRAQRGEK